MCEYNKDNIYKLLERDIFAKSKKDVRIPHLDNYKETKFNRLFEKAVNSELMGNCLRWMTIK